MTKAVDSAECQQVCSVLPFGFDTTLLTLFVHSDLVVMLLAEMLFVVSFAQQTQTKVQSNL